jgi:hypothetical protein
MGLVVADMLKDNLSGMASISLAMMVVLPAPEGAARMTILFT